MPSSTKKKKKRTKVKNISMGDTVKLTKGRIGLVRYIGKTQFGLGEWIGIELYNELIRTRHNGAVLGKRYFQCPAHRGVFVRRSLIKENIPVLDIQPSINKLREKEKKLKQERKKERKTQRADKKAKNEEKRAAKALKIQQKYANKTPSPSPLATQSPPSILTSSTSPITPGATTTSTPSTSTPSSSKSPIKSPTKRSSKKLGTSSAAASASSSSGALGANINTHSRRSRNGKDMQRSRSANPPSDNKKKSKPKSPTKPKSIRPKTPNSSSKRPKTPTTSSSRGSKTPKTPTLQNRDSGKVKIKKRDKKQRASTKPKSSSTESPDTRRRVKVNHDDMDDQDEDGANTPSTAAPLKMAVAEPLIVRNKQTGTSTPTGTKSNKKYDITAKGGKKRKSASMDKSTSPKSKPSRLAKSSSSSPRNKENGKISTKKRSSQSNKKRKSESNTQKHQKSKSKDKVPTSPKLQQSYSSSATSPSSSKTKPKSKSLDKRPSNAPTLKQSKSESSNNESESDDEPPEPSLTDSTNSARPSTPIIDDLDDLEKLNMKVIQEPLDVIDAEPEPNNVPQIAPPKQIVELEIKALEQNDYKLKSFNTNFKDSLNERESKDSLQLLFNRQKKEEEQKEAERRKEEKKKQTGSGASSPRSPTSTKKKKKQKDSIKIFEQKEEDMKNVNVPQVIDDDLEANVEDKKILGMSPTAKSTDDAKENHSSFQYAPTRDRNKQSVHIGPSDGVLDSDEDSLNEEEDDDDDDDDDEELKKELEEDFEQNFENMLKSVDEYNKTIDSIETTRKIMADKLVTEARERRNSMRRSGPHISPPHAPNAAPIFTRNRSGGLTSDHSSPLKVAKSPTLSPMNSPRFNANLMMAGHTQSVLGPAAIRSRQKKKSKKDGVYASFFNQVRSRRGSSFVDDYNVMDTLFFDGDEESSGLAQDPDSFYVESMGSDDEDDEDEDDKKTPLPSKGNLVEPIIEEEDEDDDDDDDDEQEEDPLLGTIEEEEEEEEEEDCVEDEVTGSPVPVPEPEYELRARRSYKMSDIMENDPSLAKTIKSELNSLQEGDHEDADDFKLNGGGKHKG